MTEKKEKDNGEKELIAEGIVARPAPLMLYRDGTPIMFKLKLKDYEKLGEA